MPESNRELISFPDDAALAETAAGLWLREASASRRDGSWTVALSGGRIARRFFTAIVEQNRRQPAALTGVDFFWADERCVPPTDSESNYALAWENLLAPLAIDSGRIHRLRGEDEPSAAASAAELELCRVASVNGSVQPVLDLVILGMGEDGHVASLFPNEPEATRNAPSVYRAVVSSKPPPRRLTLGYAALSAARQVWVLASGPGKEQALANSLALPSTTPLGRLLARRGATRIFTDIKLGA